jgi:hypothetical protein
MGMVVSPFWFFAEINVGDSAFQPFADVHLIEGLAATMKGERVWIIHALGWVQALLRPGTSTCEKIHKVRNLHLGIAARRVSGPMRIVVFIHRPEGTRELIKNSA